METISAEKANKVVVARKNEQVHLEGQGVGDADIEVLVMGPTHHITQLFLSKSGQT